MAFVNRYADLFRGDRVSSSVYTSEEIYEEELRKIFHRTWVYVGHESEIRNPGDFQVRFIGKHSVIMGRDPDGKVLLMLNRCIHRGNAVCQRESGNVRFYRCAYHGWTYNLRGELTGVVQQDGYDPKSRAELPGLAMVPKVGIYRGFIFGSLSDAVPDFETWLSEPSKRMIDLALDLSPEGEIEVCAGVTKSIYKANWKFMGMDGYHAPVTHKSPLEMMQRQREIAEDNQSKRFLNTTAMRGVVDTSPNTPGTDTSALSAPRGKKVDPALGLTRELGDGQVMLDFLGSRRARTPQVMASWRQKPWAAAYIEKMEKRYGKKRAEELIVLGGDPHMAIYPNLQIIAMHIRVTRPLSANLTEVMMYPTLLKGVPDELNAQRMRDHEFFYSPMGFGTPDDYEMFERNQMGLEGDSGPEVILTRGLAREETESDGTTIAHVSDEITQRGQLRWWAELMSAPE